VLFFPQVCIIHTHLVYDAHYKAEQHIRKGG
jgi:hypothetical protein